ncbi:uncharacterized protein EAF01_003304 [Botrytis porri]|uniref:AB hydrolase-1 domain-containing protein n=1 Tax=Botrytis porri TaxID=87229 RepID=A0A4Z1KU78_9HELO|nr:uncharacterized protein EAF01_003304 [Botrytis porri]KAF7909586.1 hypothetical protein EAF01_003304 [Botrytis porri]TGO88075.1 hypothetical protein BPOR_0185g00010 [Botrytis porri]
MKKTILLCFIHGFKGGDDTFGSFPEHLRALVSHGLPKVKVRAITYPQYETRGDLGECVSRFRDWLQEKVIDIEVQNGTPSPTVDPSVRTILIGHSMGGIVAADTALAITSDKVIDSKETTDAINAFMFPYIQGVLAFDTPYLGISPGVVAHGAEGHYNAATSAFAQVSSLAGALWGEKEVDKTVEEKKPVAALPAPPPPEAPAWKKWGTLAIYAGAAGAIAAGGAAAYFKKDQIQEGWSWVGSHLEFVGCLMKGEELKKRVAGMVTLRKELEVGWANLYTRLGKEAVSKADGSLVGSVIGNQRTFCNLPKTSAKDFFREAINDKAADETSAHMTMFFPKENPGYYTLSEDAKKLIVEWSTNEWYESSTRERSTPTRERSTSTRERSTPTRERSISTREHSASARERPTPTRERSSITRDPSTNTKERPAITRERSSITREPSTNTKERPTITRERSTKVEHELR